MKNVMEAIIVNRNDIVTPLRGREKEQVTIVLRSVANWLADMRRRPKPQRFLCLDCDTTFHARRMPEAFAVTLPLMPEEGHQAAATGICRRCAEKDSGALIQKFVERLRAYYPDLTIIQGGQA